MDADPPDGLIKCQNGPRKVSGSAAPGPDGAAAAVTPGGIGPAAGDAAGEAGGESTGESAGAAETAGCTSAFTLGVSAAATGAAAGATAGAATAAGVTVTGVTVTYQGDAGTEPTLACMPTTPLPIAVAWPSE